MYIGIETSKPGYITINTRQISHYKSINEDTTIIMRNGHTIQTRLSIGEIEQLIGDEVVNLGDFD